MEDGKTILRKGIECWNAHDRDGFLALFAPDVVFVDEPTGRRLVGGDQLGRGFYDLWTDAYPDNVLRTRASWARGT
jgi:hypothetical protein